MAGNKVYVQGSYVDIHDNQVVNLSIDKAGTVQVQQEVDLKEYVVPDIPPLLDTPRARELWQKAIAQGWVDEQLQPLLSRSDAALLAARMGQVLGIEGWKPFEHIWNRRNMRQDYLRGIGKKEASELLDALKKKLR